MEYIYDNFGVEIIKRNDKYYLIYDAGGIVVQIKEIEITEKEAKEIQSIHEADNLYQYLIKNLNDRM